MKQFWQTITKIKDSSSYQFKLDKKNCRVDVEVFDDILQICPRLPNQEFVVPPTSNPEIVSFIKELGYTDINRFLSGKTTGLDKIRLSRAQILWGMYYNQNVDFVELLWENFMKMMNSTAYKTYLAFATGVASPKKERKFKEPASLSKKKTLVAVDDPAKKPATRRQSAGVQIRVTPNVIKRRKWETNVHQAGGSSEGASLEPEVPDEQKGKSSDASEGTGLIPGVPDVSKADCFKSEYESWGDSDDDQQSDDEQNMSDNLRTSDDEEETQEDEFVHTPENYVPTDDENVDDKEYERINKEMYDDVNVELKDADTTNEGKGDEDMTDAKKVNADNKNVNQEVTGDQVNDDARATVTASLATYNTEVPLQISFISFDYATKFLNINNIPLADTEIISMMDIKVQHEDPSSQTSPLLIVPVLVIPESSTAPATTIPPPIPPFIPLPQQSTPIPTTTTTEATISTTYAPDSSTLTAIHQRLSDLENDIKTLRNVDHSLVIRAVIKSEIPSVVKEYIKTSLDDTLHKQQKRKHKALYHALMEFILVDEDVMDKGVAKIQKKRKPDDADRDEDPPAGPDQGLKRRKTSKETEPSKKAKSTGTSKSTTKSQPKYTGKSAQVEETVIETADTHGPRNLGEDIGNTDEPPIVNTDLKDWFKKSKRPHTLDPEWNKCKTFDNKPT
ncbi:hypothetical protein Tco_1139406 [Tanacetum coccineum]